MRLNLSSFLPPVRTFTASAQPSAYAVGVYYFHGKVNQHEGTLIQQLLRGQGLNKYSSLGKRRLDPQNFLESLIYPKVSENRCTGSPGRRTQTRTLTLFCLDNQPGVPSPTRLMRRRGSGVQRGQSEFTLFLMPNLGEAYLWS